MRDNTSTPKGNARNMAKWKRLSTKVRKAQPFCLDCGTTKSLEADHIIPIAVAPELAYEILNLTTRCRTCNARRGTNYTEGEAQAVRTAIAARKQRQSRYHAGIATPAP